MCFDRSIPHRAPRSSLSRRLARVGSAAALALMVVTCHSESTAPPVPKSLVFTVQPGNADAVTALAPVQVSVQDGAGNTLSSFDGPVSIALGNNPGSANMSVTTVNASAGVATFSSLVVNRPGNGYTLRATTTAAAGVIGTSGSFSIVPGPVAQLSFNVQPHATTAGVTISPAIQVTTQDAAGNTVTTYSGNVTMSIGTNPTGGTLSGIPTVAAASGVATFSDLSIKQAGRGYKLAATAGAGSGQSNAFDIMPAAATQLVFTVQPTVTHAGSSFTPPVVVTALDGFGNTATGFVSDVTIEITTGTGKAGAALSGTSTMTASAGVATFAALSIDSVGTGYTLSATALGLVGGFASASFDIIPGAATHLVFTQQPTGATAGANLSPDVTVTALDAKGNVDTGYTGNVTLAIGTNAGGGTLTGGGPVAASAGVATFPGLNIPKSGTGYTLTASSGTLTGATSTAFNITAGAATRLAFTVQPVNTAAGATVAPSIKVAAQDALGNTDLTYGANVSLSIGNNPGGGSLTGGGPVAASAGVATFAASIDKVGTGYTLTASSGALTGATSNAFDIVASAATHLVFSAQPVNAVAGVAIAPAVVIQALDGSDNLATGFSGGITLSITSGTGDPAGALSGRVVLNATGGVATFDSLVIKRTGGNYRLDATTGGIPVATSTTFDITPAAATHLGFSQQPTDATQGVALIPAVTVSALDAFDNVNTAYTATIAIDMGTNPSGGTLSGSTAVAAANGVASFGNLSISKGGTAYTLHAASDGLLDAISASFNVRGPAKLAFSVQPTTAKANVAIAPAVVVQVQDALGNPVPNATDAVTMAMGTNGGSPTPGTLQGTLTVAAVNGAATFSDLTIDKSGAGYTLHATSGALTDAASAEFAITPGAATQLAFSVAPRDTTAGATINGAGGVKVVAQDPQGNTDTSFTGNIAMAISGGKAGAVLSGGGPVAAVKGIATFSGLSIDSAGTNYKLTGTGGSLTSAVSVTFNIDPGPVTQLVFVQQPSTTPAGAPITPSVSLVAKDASGNINSTYTGTVTLSLPVNPGGATPSNNVATATAGVVTFPGLFLDKVGTGYRLRASDGVVTSAQSAPFDITTGVAVKLAFGVQPSQATLNATITPAVTVLALDANDNLVTNYTSNVTVSKATGPGTLSGTVNIAAVGGVARFSTLKLDATGTYTLEAMSGTLAAATSNSFDITASVATQLAFDLQPNTATAGATFSTVTIQAKDASNQLDANFTGNVTLAITSGTGTPGAQLLTPTSKTVTAVGGVATFSDLHIDVTGINYQLTATSDPLTPAKSKFFSIDPGPADHLVFGIQPSTVTRLASIAPAVEVVAQDALNNTATSFTGTVTTTLNLNGNTGGVLSGATAVPAVKGVATFSTLSVNQAGNGYTLSAGGLGSPVTSVGFDVAASTASHLAFTQQPTTTVAGHPITPAIVVTAQDAANATLTGFNGDVTLSIKANTGTSGATLSGARTVAAINGVATFPGLSIDKTGTGYRLDAVATSLAGATSTSFGITPGVGTHLEFTTDPVTTTAGATIPTVVVTALDAFGNPDTSYTANVTVRISVNPGSGTLFGDTTVAASGGVASFPNLSIDRAETGYELQASSGALTPAGSNAFSISGGAATHLVYTVVPTDAQAGNGVVGGNISSPHIRVAGYDAFGNVDKNFADNVALTITSGTGTGGATLGGTATVAAASGVAEFVTPLGIDLVGAGYTLTATTPAAGVTGTTSAPFGITPYNPSKLGFVAQPSNTAANTAITPPVRIAVQDQFGNVVTSSTAAVTVAIGTDGSGSIATLGGTKKVNAVSGVATFSDLTINLTGTGYTLSAVSGSLAGAISLTFNIF